MYAAFIEPFFVRSIVDSIQNAAINRAAAGVILCAVVVESIALWQKVPFLKARIREPVTAIFPWILHVALLLILVYTAATVAGYSTRNLAPFGMIVIAGVIIKELVLLFQILGFAECAKPWVSEVWIDAALFVCSCIAYSAVWKVVIQTSPSTGLAALDITAGLALFWILYLPMVLPASIEEIARLAAARDWFRFVLFLAIPAAGSQVQSLVK